MKSIYTLAAVAALFTVSAANAQTSATQKAPAGNKIIALCAPKQTANAAIIAKAQAAATPAERAAILKAAIDADPQNAVCLADMALQMALAGGINPAAGPEEGGTTEDFTPDTTPPAENPNQLNEGTNTPTGSPSSPSL